MGTGLSCSELNEVSGSCSCLSIVLCSVSHSGIHPGVITLGDEVGDVYHMSIYIYIYIYIYISRVLVFTTHTPAVTDVLGSGRNVGALSLYSTRTQNTLRRGLALGNGPDARILRWRYQHVGTFWRYLMLKSAFSPTPTPDASQWNIGCVGSQRKMLASGMYISCFLCRFHLRRVPNANPFFWWNMGFTSWTSCTFPVTIAGAGRRHSAVNPIICVTPIALKLLPLGPNSKRGKLSGDHCRCFQCI